jgi:malate synthase
MEDAATAEISRAQLWQWIHHGAKLDDGRAATEACTDDPRCPARPSDEGRDAQEAAEILDSLVLAGVPEFLTLPAYRYLD